MSSTVQGNTKCFINPRPNSPAVTEAAAHSGDSDRRMGQRAVVKRSHLSGIGPSTVQDESRSGAGQVSQRS